MDTNEKTLLEWVVAKYPETPRSRAKQWIESGRISVDGAVIRRPHERIVNSDAVVELRQRHDTTLGCGSGWEIHPRVTLIHLDLSLAVVNKGPGLLSVSALQGDLSAQSILADFLSGRLKPRNRQVSARTLPAPYRRLEPLPVHRLDQYTSGVFCMATSPRARQKLIEQVKAHTMKREYVAFVEGKPTSPKGTWRNWLQLSDDELRQFVLAESQVKNAGPDVPLAITHYELAQSYELGGGRVASKLRIRLETGLKHQIRVQAANAGLPLIGDRTYNPAYRGLAEGVKAIEFDRQALHAESLSLEHPEHPGKQMSWRAEMPKDLRQLEAALRSKAV